MKMPNNKAKLQSLIKEKCLSFDTTWTLSAGTKSSFYFDCKKITLNGEGINLITHEILKEIDNLPDTPTAIGGLAIGADPIATYVAGKATEIGHLTANASIVRKTPKKHGTKNKIENQLEPGTKIVVVDDVITSGSSIRQACEEFIKGGYKIVGIIAIIDRKAGGKESLEADFGIVRTLFDKDDFEALRLE